MAEPTRRLSYIPEIESLTPAQVTFEDAPALLADAQSARHLLGFAVLASDFLDQIEVSDLPAAVKIQAAALRQAIEPWVPLKEGLSSVPFDAWMARIMGMVATVPMGVVPDGVDPTPERKGAELSGVARPYVGFPPLRTNPPAPILEDGCHE